MSIEYVNPIDGQLISNFVKGQAVRLGVSPLAVQSGICAAGERREQAIADAEGFAYRLNAEHGHDADWLDAVFYREPSPVRERARELVETMRADHRGKGVDFREVHGEFEIATADVEEFNPDNPEHHDCVLGVSKRYLGHTCVYVLRTPRDLAAWVAHLDAFGSSCGRYCDMGLPEGCNNQINRGGAKTQRAFVARGVFVVAIELCASCKAELGRLFAAARLGELRDEDQTL
ncbi:hypothetical protein [Mycobacteroides abscessus]